MKLWNVYLLTFEKGAVSRFVCSVRARGAPKARLRAMEKQHARLYQGKWNLFARLADSDDWRRPQNGESQRT
jgi:hypothetical protein